MPQIIQHIDKISRDKGRDVLYVTFDNNIFSDYNWETWQARKEVIEWFEDNNVKITPCAGFASEYSLEAYRGQFYIDVPYDKKEPDYIKICEYLENKDGSPRIPGVIFCYLPLDDALKNKHHDKPGFWDEWAEKF